MPKLYSYNWLLPFFILTGIYAYSQTWQQVNSNTSNEVYDMYFSNENTGFAITANGQVLKTTDAGNNWTVFINETAIKSDASIVCGGNSVICYGKDVDGNNQKVSFSIDSNTTTTAPTVQSVSFPIYHNNQEWNLEGVNAMVNTAYPDTYTDRFGVYNNAVSCSDALSIYYSNDVGSTWVKKQFTNSAFSSYPYQAYYTGTQKLIAITQYPTIMHISYDEGSTWTTHEMPAQYFYFINAGLTLGLSLVEHNKLYYTANDGTSAGLHILPEPVLNAYAYNESLVFVFGENGIIYKSVNLEEALSNHAVTNQSFTIYPNPANSSISLDYNADLISINSITIINAQGKTIHSTTGNCTTLPFNGAASGMYILQINTDQGLITKKIIVN